MGGGTIAGATGRCIALRSGDGEWNGGAAPFLLIFADTHPTPRYFRFTAKRQPSRDTRGMVPYPTDTQGKKVEAPSESVRCKV